MLLWITHFWKCLVLYCLWSPSAASILKVTSVYYSLSKPTSCEHIAWFWAADSNVLERSISSLSSEDSPGFLLHPVEASKAPVGHTPMLRPSLSKVGPCSLRLSAGCLGMKERLKKCRRSQERASRNPGQLHTATRHPEPKAVCTNHYLCWRVWHS